MLGDGRGAVMVGNGYIIGRNLALESGKRIVQSWRTKKFTAADPDSEIEVLLDGHTSYPTAAGSAVISSR